MGKAGRKNKYETHVKPNFEKIKKWYLTKTETQIANKLGYASYGGFLSAYKKFFGGNPTCKSANDN